MNCWLIVHGTKSPAARLPRSEFSETLDDDNAPSMQTCITTNTYQHQFVSHS